MATSPTALAQAQAQATTQKAPKGLDLYLRFALAGALGCSITHGAFTPVDVYVAPSASALALAPLSLNDTSTASRPRFSLTLLPTIVA